MEKITKRDRYLELRSLVADHADLVEFIDHELELLEKKNASRSLKPSKSATENAKYAEIVYNAMEDGKRYTISELQNSVAELNGMSNQRVTAIVRSLLKVGQVDRTEEKGKAFFSKI